MSATYFTGVGLGKSSSSSESESQAAQLTRDSNFVLLSVQGADFTEEVIDVFISASGFIGKLTNFGTGTGTGTGAGAVNTEA
jgi:hypothetical protein